MTSQAAADDYPVSQLWWRIAESKVHSEEISVFCKLVAVNIPLGSVEIERR